MYPLLDLHCDTLYALKEDPLAGDLLANTLHVDIERMERLGMVTSCFAIFVDKEESPSPWKDACALHDLFLSSLEKYGTRIRQVRTSDEILSSTTPCAMLTCEEGEILEGDLSRLQVFHSWGVMMAGLTWNYENALGYPHTLPSMPLKPLGIEAISEMERLGIVVDVSHLSDEMLRALGNAGGVAGLNFCPAFLSSDVHSSSLADMVRHAKHMRNKGGSGILAIGTDFDGIDGKLAIADISGMERLWDALGKAGFSQGEREGMWQKNALRVFSA